MTCYMCGLQAGTKSIRFHHEKCAARWPATEARPLPPAVVVPAGGAALAEALKVNAALTSLNLANNVLGAEGVVREAVVAEAVSLSLH